MGLLKRLFKNMEKKVKINNKEINYKTAYRNIKYPRLEFRTGNLLVVLPRGVENEKHILEKHKKWIFKNYNEIDEAIKKAEYKELNRRISLEEFKEFVNEKVEKFSGELKAKVNKITIRKMISKWGSLSSKGNISINSYVRFLPEYLIEYIIYHEMIHFLERKHNAIFWKLIKNKYENYKEYKKELYSYWFLIQCEIKK